MFPLLYTHMQTNVKHCQKKVEGLQVQSPPIKSLQKLLKRAEHEHIERVLHVSVAMHRHVPTSYKASH